jgi:hypothetical protein
MDKLFTKGLVDMTVGSSSGQCVCDTKQLKGEASKDSLFGTNSTVEYSTSLKIAGLGKMGDKNGSKDS